MMLFKNQWFNIIIVVVILVLIMPGTRKPIQIFFNKVLSFSPSITSKEDRKSIASYYWSLEKNNKDRENLSQYEGEVILINFWATWCPPCIAEMPSFQDLYVDYQNKITFIFVSSEDHETVRGYLNRKNFTLPAYRPLSQPPQPMNGNTLPTTYLLDRYGNIVIQKIGAADWNSEAVRKAIDELLVP